MINVMRREHDYTGFMNMLKYLSNDKSIKNIVEIGSYLGETAMMFAQVFDTTIYTVDPFIGGYDDNDIASKSDMKSIEQQFLENIKPYSDIQRIKLKSVDAAKLFEPKSVDFVYIDGCHLYKSVKEDIINWLPKIKPSGYIGGHDIVMSDVKQAVSEHFKQYKTFEDNSWLVKL